MEAVRVPKKRTKVRSKPVAVEEKPVEQKQAEEVEIGRQEIGTKIRELPLSVLLEQQQSHHSPTTTKDAQEDSDAETPATVQVREAPQPPPMTAVSTSSATNKASVVQLYPEIPQITIEATPVAPQHQLRQGTREMVMERPAPSMMYV